MFNSCSADMVLWLFLVALGVCTGAVGSANVSCGVSIVVVGSTGDLARRYVWPAIFENTFQTERHDHCALLTFGTYRGTRPGNFSSLNSHLACPLGVDTKLCDQSARAFEEQVLFMPLNSDDDFRSLAKELERSYVERNISEFGRLFYLAIPPSAYPDVCRNIDTLGRPSAGWLRVVLEKPFGRDQESAEELARRVSEHLDEAEVYRIDHYLGKAGVLQILPFRENNNESSNFPPWNARSVQRVEVAMKERLDVKGRTRFFDEYGIIRDVHQNHLTEILSRLLWDPLVGSFANQKVSILSTLYPPGPTQAVVGQYDTYQQHLVEEGVVSALVNASRTPTFASVVLYSRDARWSEVPFVLTAGKSLNERTSYARVLFRDNVFSSLGTAPSSSTCPHEMIFMIQDETLKKPGILLSWHFNRTHLSLPFPDWQVETVRYPTNVSCTYSFMSPVAVSNPNPYVSLIGAILQGQREQFVDTMSLLESWKVWTPLLQHLDWSVARPHPYSLNSLHTLDFSLGPDGVHLSNPTPSVVYHVNPLAADEALQEAATHCNFNNLGNLTVPPFGGIPTYCGSRFEIARTMAAHIYLEALDAVARRGLFHLALPGGESPLLLYQTLVLQYRDTFPWQHTHVWLTDERCVAHDNTEGSNIFLLSAHLLSLLPIPHHQAHPFPTHLQHGLCSEQDDGALLYQELLNMTTRGGALDYVVLGVGGGGHVASLFPGAGHHTASSSRLVELVEVRGEGVTLRQRMTLTHVALRQARNVGLLMSGSHQDKHSVLTGLLACFGSPSGGCGMPAYDVLLSRRGSRTSVYVDARLM